MTDADQSHDSKILVLIPTLNEEAYIADCIQSLIGPDSKNICVGVIDGQSSDATVSIVRDLQAYLPNLHLIENPKRLQSAAINLGVEILATEETRVIVRCDAHSVYPPGFVRNVATRLLEQKSASVVVPMDAIGRTCFERANAWIVDTPLGSGGSAHRGGTTSGYIDHGHHAGFDIDWFRKNGGYDETFSHNEDAEYDLRLVQAGGKIFMDADIRIGYYPRGRLSALARQYF
ncbi:MAG: glycosyltransferase family 2 protein, partial [Pseudomonadota bacterium]